MMPKAGQNNLYIAHGTGFPDTPVNFVLRITTNYIDFIFRVININGQIRHLSDVTAWI